MKFTKMQGIGNDYVYINCFEEAVKIPVQFSIRLSDRHFGIGADGLILIMPSDIADCRMRMFNADGSEGAMCGNAIRCVGKYVYDHGIVDKKNLLVETKKRHSQSGTDRFRWNRRHGDRRYGRTEADISASGTHLRRWGRL